MKESHDSESAPPEGERSRAARRRARERDAAVAREAASEPTTGQSAADASERDAFDAEGEDEEESLLPEGNPLRISRGLLVALAGALVAFVIMASTKQHRWGVPAGALAVLASTFGLLDLLGTFDDPDDRVATRTSIAELAVPLGLGLGGALALIGLVTLAVAGYVPVALSAIAVPAAFLACVVGVYGVGDRLDVWERRPDGSRRKLFERHGFWLVVLVTLLYLPLLGSHSLSDPWETHYGEVAREILSRDDWISLWWAQDGWFWSKPVLDFWIQALAMATFGVRYLPGRMLSAAAHGREPWPEWAVRLPVFLLTVIAVYVLYKAVARLTNRRAALLGGIALTTMPQWFLLAHQTMTDMPFVATMSATMGFFALALFTDPERVVRVHEIAIGQTRLRVSAYHLVFGAIIACALPQILYLLSRNVDIASPLAIRIHADAFTSGSPVNCGLPGNEACRQGIAPVLRGLQPAVQALVWAQTLALVLYLNWGERRVQRLLFLAAWFFAALATMSKGIAGFALPMLCAFVHLAVTKRWRDLTRAEITTGLLVLAAIALPWFLAMYARHGQPFTDRLLFHDMYKRAVTHVHDTNEGDDTSFRFYVWQLGYATFPWIGLLPTALVWWLRRDETRASATTELSTYLALWFAFAFALFSLMLTKFHHYIFPAVPPAAMLIGILLDDALRNATPFAGGEPARRGFVRRLAIFGATLAATAAAWLAFAHAPSPGGEGAEALLKMFRRDYWLAIGGGAIGILAIGTALALWRRLPRREDEPAREIDDANAAVERYDRVMLGAAAVAGALLTFVVGIDLAAPREGQAGQIRLMHLITYNYKRPWPTSLDFSGALWAFGVVAALVLLAFVVARWRRVVTTALASLAVLFCVWGLDVYFVRISPHWGQRETTLAYVRAAASNPGPLVAYQMNWKGENFYTGNATPAFVTSGKRFQDWIAEERAKGQHTFYFVTEHGRAGTLSNELGAPRSFDRLTTPELNNKFVLVRAMYD